MDKVLSFRTSNDDKNADTFHHTSELFIEKLDPGLMAKARKVDAVCCTWSWHQIAKHVKITCILHILHIMNLAASAASTVIFHQFHNAALVAVHAAPDQRKACGPLD